jgi:hypothetical protein
MKKAITDFINGLRLFFEIEFNWDFPLTPEFIKDIIGGVLLAIVIIALLFLSAYIA